VLNSKLASCHLRNVCPPKLSGYLKFSATCLSDTPIRSIDFSNPAGKSRHDQVVQLAEQMLALHQRLAAARTPQEKTALERQIAATDTQLDNLVYSLYGLTDAEIAIVNQARPSAIAYWPYRSPSPQISPLPFHRLLITGYRSPPPHPLKTARSPPLAPCSSDQLRAVLNRSPTKSQSMTWKNAATYSGRRF
jgi:hypothetical protein